MSICDNRACQLDMLEDVKLTSSLNESETTTKTTSEIILQENPKSLDWLIAAGVPSEELEEIKAREVHSAEITECWEKSMGYNPLNWSKLDHLRKFLLTKTLEEIKTFANWSRREYSTFTPTKACQYPDKVIELWPQAFLEETHKIKGDNTEFFRNLTIASKEKT